eukprot:gene8610-11638_t
MNVSLFLKLETPMPDWYYIDGYINNHLICLVNSKFGGIWKLSSISVDRHCLNCKLPRNIENWETNNFQFNWEMQLPSHQGGNMTIVKRQLNNKNQELKPYLFFATPLKFHCRMSIYTLSDINTVDQCFKADAYCELRLRGISTEYDQMMIDQFLQIYDIIKCIEFLGVLEENDKVVYNSFSKSSMVENTYDYTIKIRHKGLFSERMELEYFPFDQQLLNMCLTFSKPNGSIILLENEDYPSIFMVNNFQLASIFDCVFKSFVFAHPTESDPSESSSGYIYPRINFSIALNRKPGYYVSNVMVPIFTLGMISFLSFGINEDGTKMDTGTRLGIVLTLLLTAVAYKLVASSSLPQVSYNTLLDWYVWYCFAIILIIAIEIVIFPIIVSHGVPSYVEWYCAAFIFITGTIVICCYAYWIRWKQSKKDLGLYHERLMLEDKNRKNK